MKKFSKLLVAAVLALSLGLTAAGCGGNGNTGGDNPGGDNPGGDNPGGNTGVTATLDFYTSVISSNSPPCSRSQTRIRICSTRRGTISPL